MYHLPYSISAEGKNSYSRTVCAFPKMKKPIQDLFSPVWIFSMSWYRAGGILLPGHFRAQIPHSYHVFVTYTTARYLRSCMLIATASKVTARTLRVSASHEWMNLAAGHIRIAKSKPQAEKSILFLGRPGVKNLDSWVNWNQARYSFI